jgi:predicted transcriptional regulator YheO
MAENVIGPYGKMNWDGRRLKSITAVIRDPEERPVGLLCTNLDIEAFTGLLGQLKELIELPKPAQQPAALFAKDWREGVNAIVVEFLVARNVTLAGLNSEDIDGPLAKLDRRGVFEIRRVVPYVADVLRLSRATVYNRLGSVRQQAETKGRENAKE